MAIRKTWPVFGHALAVKGLPDPARPIDSLMRRRIRQHVKYDTRGCVNRGGDGHGLFSHVNTDRPRRDK
jgi:hypothetical protein